MDSTVMILIQQIVIMFLMMALGYLLYRMTMIDSNGVREMSNICLFIGTPATILYSFFKPFESQVLIQAGWSFLLALISFLLSIVLTKTCFKSSSRIAKFGIIFSNVGFLGIPLVEEVLGTEYVFYMSMVVVALNVILWIYGVVLISGDKKQASFSKLLLNPNTIVVIVGLLIYCLQIPVPYAVQKTTSYIAGLNAPLAMIVLGSYLAQTDIKKLVSNHETWVIMLGRNILSPLVTLVFLLLLPTSMRDIGMVVLIGAATPTAGSLAMMCQRYGSDFSYGAGVVGITTILSLVTMPVFVYLFNLFA